MESSTREKEITNDTQAKSETTNRYAKPQNASTSYDFASQVCLIFLPLIFLPFSPLRSLRFTSGFPRFHNPIYVNVIGNRW
jgi:hypothetical protein